MRTLGAKLDTDLIIRRYLGGESSVAIGQSLGCTHRTVLVRLRSAGVKPRGQGKVKPFGPKHHRWKGGRTINGDGYVLLSVRGRRVFEHRFVIEQLYARRLRSDEHVHHVDRNPSNNHPDNLVVMGIAEHERYHRRAERQNRTHCRRGHEFLGSNVLVRRDGSGRSSRTCRTCRNAAKRRLRDRVAEAAGK